MPADISDVSVFKTADTAYSDACLMYEQAFEEMNSYATDSEDHVTDDEDEDCCCCIEEIGQKIKHCCKTRAKAQKKPGSVQLEQLRNRYETQFPAGFANMCLLTVYVQKTRLF